MPFITFKSESRQISYETVKLWPGNSGLQKPLKSSKFWILLEVLTVAIFFVKCQCFPKKITKSMFSQKTHLLKLNINLRKKKK